LHRVPSSLWNIRAVDVFVILSGFAIATLVDQKHEPYPQYIARRFLRIFPVYWFYLILSVATIGLAYTVWSSPSAGSMQISRAQIAASSIQDFWPHLLVHIPALHALVPSRFLPLSEFAFLGQAWSISLEWQFYLIAPFAIALLVKASRNWKIAGAVLVAVLLLNLAARQMPMGFIGGYSVLFGVGIGTYFLLKARREGQDWASRMPVLPLLFALIGSLFLIGSPYAVPLSIWAIVSACNATPAGILRPLSTFLTLPIVQAIGKMSYSLYLSHMLVLTLGLYLLARFGIGSSMASAALLLAFTLVGSLVLSIASYNLIERPFQQLGRRISGSRSAAEQAVASTGSA
jgi:peptidoglycan/LPS O-acetylase OafA/YrhL